MLDGEGFRCQYADCDSGLFARNACSRNLVWKCNVRVRLRVEKRAARRIRGGVFPKRSADVSARNKWFCEGLKRETVRIE